MSSFLELEASAGSVLVGLLWCLALLSVIVIGVLYSVRLELRVAKNQGDSIQAHYLALAGIEKAKSLLYQDAAERKRGATHHSQTLYDAPEQLREVPLGRGYFSVLRQGGRDEGGQVMFGVSDEESRLNVNRASSSELARLYQIKPEQVAALIDWRDGNNTPANGGAEIDYYASLQRPYLPRNAPFKTIRELLMVRDMGSEEFKGEDDNLNGWLDPEEDDGTDSLPVDNRDGVLDAGWSGLLTVESQVRNVNAAGELRINVQSADERTLASVPGISAELAKAIVAYRGQKQIEKLTDLLDVTAPAPANEPVRTSASGQPRPNAPAAAPVRGRPSRSAEPPSGSAPPQPAGPKLIDQDLLMDIADHLTTQSEQDIPGAININTASAEVLACLPGISQELAQAIVSYRKSAGFFPNEAHLLKVDGMSRQILEQMLPRLSVRSETFRIRSEGRVNSTGARKTIEVVVRLGGVSFDTLGYREDL